MVGWVPETPGPGRGADMQLHTPLLVLACVPSVAALGQHSPSPGSESIGSESIVQEVYLKPSNTDPSDLFGSSVAIHDDRLIVE